MNRSHNIIKLADYRKPLTQPVNPWVYLLIGGIVLSVSIWGAAWFTVEMMRPPR